MTPTKRKPWAVHQLVPAQTTIIGVFARGDVPASNTIVSVHSSERAALDEADRRARRGLPESGVTGVTFVVHRGAP